MSSREELVAMLKDIGDQAAAQTRVLRVETARVRLDTDAFDQKMQSFTLPVEKPRPRTVPFLPTIKPFAFDFPPDAQWYGNFIRPVTQQLLETIPIMEETAEYARNGAKDEKQSIHPSITISEEDMYS